MTTLTIGLMSGTSLDGVDAVLADFGAPGDFAARAHAHRPFPEALARELLALNSPGENELHRAALAANALAQVCAQVVGDVLARAGIERRAVRAIGAHGQTVRHRPGEFDATGYTVQLNNPALLAELTGIDVVADFRSRDVAAGGQGAPLVPAFHRALFGRPGQALAVLNIGGFANLTLLPADGATLGFDCGPGNALMDHWCLTHTGAPFDAAGAWAATGTVITPLLDVLRADAFFTLAPPKSTGRDHFNPGWLAQRLTALPGAPLDARDVQATLAALTASTCADALLRHAPEVRELLVCGGGAHNDHLMASLRAALAGVAVKTTDAHGMPAMQVEASAFAWLAWQHVERRPGNLASVTGARGARVLGALYPAE